MIVSLSHTDLDGSGCQIVLNNTFQEVIYYNATYGKIQEYLEILDDTITNKRCAVFITDLMFRGDDYTKLLELCNKHSNIKFYYIDHHSYDFELLGLPNLKIIHFEGKSASLLTYEFLKNRCNNEIEHLINCINAFDIHDTASKDYDAGFVLNELFWNYKQKLFFNRFKEHRPKLLTETDKKNYLEIVKEKEKMFEKAEKNGTLFKMEDKLCLTFFDKYFSFFTRENNFKLYINIYSYGGVSIRFREDLEEDKVIMVRNELLNFLENSNWTNSQGGHIFAWGCSLKEDTPDFMLAFAKDFTEKAINSIIANEL